MRFQYDYAHQEVGTRTRRRDLRRAVASATILFLFFAGVPFFLGADVASDRDSDVASRIRSLEELKFEAQHARNVAALDTIFDDGLMWVDANGTLSTKAGYLEALRESASSRLRVVSMSARVFGQMVIVVGVYDEIGVKNNRPYRQRCRFIDTWTFKRDKWVMIAATATSTIS